MSVIPHEHGQDVGVVSADETLGTQLFKVPLCVRIYRIIDFSLQRREFEILHDNLGTDPVRMS